MHRHCYLNLLVCVCVCEHVCTQHILLHPMQFCPQGGGLQEKADALIKALRIRSVAWRREQLFVLLLTPQGALQNHYHTYRFTHKQRVATHRVTHSVPSCLVRAQEQQVTMQSICNYYTVLTSRPMISVKVMRQTLVILRIWTRRCRGYNPERLH